MAAPARLSASEYFAIDEAALDEKYELIDGVAYAMAGGSPTHARLGSALAVVLAQGLRGTGCVTYSSDLRVKIDSRNYAYPDHTIICGPVETAGENINTATNPTVIFEVLSPSTEDYDRGRKSLLYRQIPSLTAIVLVSQTSPSVEITDRQGDGSWNIRAYDGLDAQFLLPTTKEAISLAELYAGVVFPDRAKA